MPRDHVSSMHADENTLFVTEYEGEKYYFCSEECKKSFDRDPQKYQDLARTNIPTITIVNFIIDFSTANTSVHSTPVIHLSSLESLNNLLFCSGKVCDCYYSNNCVT